MKKILNKKFLDKEISRVSSSKRRINLKKCLVFIVGEEVVSEKQISDLLDLENAERTKVSYLDLLTGNYKASAYQSCKINTKKICFVSRFFRNLSVNDYHSIIQKLPEKHLNKDMKLRLNIEETEIFCGAEVGCLRFLDSNHDF